MDEERGEAWLGAKRGGWPHASNGSFVVWRHCDELLRCSGHAELIVSDEPTAHNMALGGLSGGSLWGLGGKVLAKTVVVPSDVLIFARAHTGGVKWGPSGISAHSAGCIERRVRYRDWGCQYDGRFAVTTRNGRMFVYARANTLDRGGGRHVTVASAPVSSPPTPSPHNWSRFELVTFLPPGEAGGGNVIAATLANETHAILTANIYMASVSAYGDGFVGLFPVTTAQFAGAAIVLAISCDGRHFSSAVPVVSVLDAGGGEVNDHTVNGLFVNADFVYMYAHHGVPGTWHKIYWTCPFYVENKVLDRLPHSHVARYAMPRPAFDAHVARARQQLREAGQC